MPNSTPPAGTLRPPVGGDDHVQDGVTAAAVAAAAGPVVELVEFGDFQCPHCARAATVVNQLRAELGGRLRFAFRHFPLARLHPLARAAAEASEAAAAQGAFWPMHDLLFARAPDLAEPHLLAYAAELGLDAGRVAAELAAGVHAARVQRDVSGGARSGVNGTPTFFVGGLRHNGPYELDALRAALGAAAKPDQNPNE